MIRLIAAIDQKRGIAKQGVQPWHLPNDERYFNEMTISHGANILMGQRTLEVIGHPLKDRSNFVLSRQNQEPQNTVEYVHNLETFLKDFTQDLWVIGGASVYEQTISYAQELYLTEIDFDFGCDKFFPDFKGNFALSKKSGPHLQNGYTFSYAVYINSQ